MITEKVEWLTGKEGIMIKFFFAVTMTGVYRVGMEKGCYGYAEKIAVNKESLIGIGERLEGGYMIAVGQRLTAYVPEGHSMASPLTSVVRELEQVNTRWWGGSTSTIVALFKNRKKALACLKAKDNKPGDSRYWAETQAVLEAIGPDHIAFYVCQGCGLELTCETEKAPA